MDSDYFTNNAKLRNELASCWQIIEQEKAALATANERIMELEAGSEKAGAVVININADRIALRKDLAAEREVSDKLVAALMEYRAFFASIPIGRKTLSEVAAIRAKQGQQE